MPAATVEKIGNSWAFARRNRFRVKALPLKEQDNALKEQGRHLKEQAPVYTINRSLISFDLFKHTQIHASIPQKLNIFTF